MKSKTTKPKRKLTSQPQVGLERARQALTEANDIVTQAIPNEKAMNKRWLLRNTKKYIQDAQYSLVGAL
jgi:hypothetical protein